MRYFNTKNIITYHQLLQPIKHTPIPLPHRQHTRATHTSSYKSQDYQQINMLGNTATLDYLQKNERQTFSLLIL